MDLDHSIDIADRIGDLYVVDSYICICRLDTFAADAN